MELDVVIDGHPNKITCIESAGKFFFLGTSAGSVLMYKLEGPRDSPFRCALLRSCDLGRGKKDVVSILAHPESKRIFVLSDERVSMLDFDTLRKLYNFTDTKSAIAIALDSFPGSTHMAICSKKHIYRFDFSLGVPALVDKVPIAQTPVTMLLYGECVLTGHSKHYALTRLTRGGAVKQSNCKRIDISSVDMNSLAPTDALDTPTAPSKLFHPTMCWLECSEEVVMRSNFDPSVFKVMKIRDNDVVLSRLCTLSFKQIPLTISWCFPHILAFLPDSSPSITKSIEVFDLNFETIVQSIPFRARLGTGSGLGRPLLDYSPALSAAGSLAVSGQRQNVWLCAGQERVVVLHPPDVMKQVVRLIQHLKITEAFDLFDKLFEGTPEEKERRFDRVRAAANSPLFLRVMLEESLAQFLNSTEVESSGDNLDFLQAPGKRIADFLVSKIRDTIYSPATPTRPTIDDDNDDTQCQPQQQLTNGNNGSMLTTMVMVADGEPSPNDRAPAFVFGDSSSDGDDGENIFSFRNEEQRFRDGSQSPPRSRSSSNPTNESPTNLSQTPVSIFMHTTLSSSSSQDTASVHFPGPGSLVASPTVDLRRAVVQNSTSGKLKKILGHDAGLQAAVTISTTNVSPASSQQLASSSQPVVLALSTPRSYIPSEPICPPSSRSSSFLSMGNNINGHAPSDSLGRLVEEEDLRQSTAVSLVDSTISVEDASLVMHHQNFLSVEDLTQQIEDRKQALKGAANSLDRASLEAQISSLERQRLSLFVKDQLAKLKEFVGERIREEDVSDDFDYIQREFFRITHKIEEAPMMAVSRKRALSVLGRSGSVMFDLDRATSRSVTTGRSFIHFAGELDSLDSPHPHHYPTTLVRSHSSFRIPSGSLSPMSGQIGLSNISGVSGGSAGGGGGDILFSPTVSPGGVVSPIPSPLGPPGGPMAGGGGGGGAGVGGGGVAGGVGLGGQSSHQSRTKRILVEAFQKGLKASLEKQSMLLEDFELLPEDYTVVRSFRIQTKVSSSFATEQQAPLENEKKAKSGIKWKEHAPQVFQKLRKRFNADNDIAMRNSLCQDGCLQDMNTNSRSGSLFFFSKDSKYIVKTINETESKLLLSILRPYTEYVLRNNNTLLPAFLGLFEFGTEKAMMYTVIMKNLFDCGLSISERYDLKGSTVARTVGKIDSEFNYSDDSSVSTGVSLKDNDLKEPVEIGPGMRQVLLEQLESDCKFLNSFNIMDYSLLLGMHHEDPSETLLGMKRHSHSHHYASEETSNKLYRPSVFQSYKGGILAYPWKQYLMHQQQHRRGMRPIVPGVPNEGGGMEMPTKAKTIYYFGIIDCLQQYDFGKRMENAAKSIRYFTKADEISAVEPDKYLKRFMEFMAKIFI